MKKSITFLILLFAILSLSVVSASENATDLEINDIADEVILSDGPSGEINESTGGDVKSDSTLTVKDTKGYETFKTEFKVTLTSNGTNLASKKVIINLNSKNFTRTTDSAGQAILKINLSKGTYDVKCYFLGDKNTNPSQGSAKITVVDPKKTVIDVADKDISYRQGSKSVFIVRLLTETGASVKNQTVTFRVDGKTYKAVTDSKGYAQIFLSLKKGTHKVFYTFKGKKPYLSSTGSTKIKVKSSMGKGNGYWMWASGIKSVSLKTLKSKGTKQIFLNSYAVSLYGRSTVTSWIAKANKYGMKVHIWAQVFYEGNWVRPVKADGTPDYKYMKKKVAQLVSYSKMKGVAGIHMDYLRFGGTAHLYNNSEKAINYMTKKACVEVRKVSPNCIMSAAVMPEPDSMLYYYGQEIPTMSKYLDVIIPMSYKGNYGKTTPWIGDVTNWFVNQSNGAQIWAGLQSYKSDDNVQRLSHSELLKDARNAMNSGAKGVVLFRIGVTNLLNFYKV